MCFISGSCVCEEDGESDKSDAKTEGSRELEDFAGPVVSGVPAERGVHLGLVDSPACHANALTMLEQIRYRTQHLVEKRN